MNEGNAAQVGQNQQVGQRQPPPQQAQGNNGDEEEQPGGTTKIKVTVLDGIVSVNALFTVAIFLGLTFNPTQQSMETEPRCEAGIRITKQLVLFEVISFSFFLFSSVVAQGLKMAIVVLNAKDRRQSSHAYINLCLLKFGIVLSGICSVFGCVFLITSIVFVIQIRFGKLSCQDEYTIWAVVIMCVMIPIGLLVYFFIGLSAFMKNVEGRGPR